MKPLWIDATCLFKFISRVCPFICSTAEIVIWGQLDRMESEETSSAHASWKCQLPPVWSFPPRVLVPLRVCRGYGDYDIHMPDHRDGHVYLKIWGEQWNIKMHMVESSADFLHLKGKRWDFKEIVVLWLRGGKSSSFSAGVLRCCLPRNPDSLHCYVANQLDLGFLLVKFSRVTWDGGNIWDCDCVGGLALVCPSDWLVQERKRRGGEGWEAGNK